MKIEIDSRDLVKLLNEAIYYGGDAGGPYFSDSRDLKRKMLEIFNGKLELKFNNGEFTRGNKTILYDLDIVDIINSNLDI